MSCRCYSQDKKVRSYFVVVAGKLVELPFKFNSSDAIYPEIAYLAPGKVAVKILVGLTTKPGWWCKLYVVTLQNGKILDKREFSFSFSFPETIEAIPIDWQQEWMYVNNRVFCQTDEERNRAYSVAVPFQLLRFYQDTERFKFMNATISKDEEGNIVKDRNGNITYDATYVLTADSIKNLKENFIKKESPSDTEEPPNTEEETASSTGIEVEIEISSISKPNEKRFETIKLKIPPLKRKPPSPPPPPKNETYPFAPIWDRSREKNNNDATEEGDAATEEGDATGLIPIDPMKLTVVAASPLPP